MEEKYGKKSIQQKELNHIANTDENAVIERAWERWDTSTRYG